MKSAEEWIEEGKENAQILIGGRLNGKATRQKNLILLNIRAIQADVLWWVVKEFEMNDERGSIYATVSAKADELEDKS